MIKKDAIGITGRSRYRRSIFGKLILQVEEGRKIPRVHCDGYWAADCLYTEGWRDARLDDLDVLNRKRQEDWRFHNGG